MVLALATVLGAPVADAFPYSSWLQVMESTHHELLEELPGNGDLFSAYGGALDRSGVGDVGHPEETSPAPQPVTDEELTWAEAE